MLWAAWALLALCGAGARAAWAPGGACPRLYRKQFHGYTPIGNLTAGNYTEQPSLKVLGQCIMGCCVSETCNVVFKVDDKCYHVECYSNELCMPLLRTESPKVGTHASMILVKPVLPNENWEDILANYREQSISSNLSPKDDMDPYTNDRHDLILDDDEQERLSLSRLLNLPDIDEIEHRARVMHPNDYYDPNELDIAKICEIRSDTDCPLHAQCNAITLRSRKGICQCKPGYKENSNGDCVPMFSKNSAEQGEEMDIPRLLKEATKPDISSERSIQKLTVSIESKQIELPENKVTLSAYTIPDEKATMSHYNYAWTLVDQPKEGFTGNMNQNGGMVTLTDLTEGQYRFKVTVNGTNSYGEGFANVTVLPAERINKPPQVVITPVTQTVKMPNTGAVLDGSASKDDDHIISWHWEVASGPIGYQPPLQEGSTLVLTDLKQPGNYTFKLTVEDSDHVKNSTTANITVLSHADYPPEANAGEDVIVYLPNNKLTLNGSLSTDDHEITSWEWTKAAEDANKAVDMQNTHSPYLQLSNLSEGAYAFVLKVTDSSGQSSTAEVHVFVKPATNTPPVADAGPDQFISLPQTWAILNGSTSHDDHRIVAYTWSYLSGPTNSNILLYNESIANATALTKGEYMFKLTVLDDSGNSATDNVTVTVTQNKNSPPKADGGGDQTLSLPVPVLILNGSRSSDDFRIVSYKWTRSGSGMAAGKVILDSDTKPVLMLTNIVPGRYVFELMVTDDQGAADRDTVSVQVKPNPLEQHLLEMTLNAPVSSFTQSQLDSSMQKLQLLLKEGIKINITDVRVELDSDNTQIVFYLYEQTTPVEGRRALALVRGAGWGAGGGAAGGAVVARLRSVRCLSTCSGRGACDQQTRSCRCDAFWMQNLFTQYDPEAQPNCDWSVVYASLGTVGTMATAAAACWGVTRGARRLCAAVRRPSAPRTKYRLLTPSNHEDIPFTSNNISDTETDSDVLFESKNSTFLSNRLLNGELPQLQGSSKKNGHFKSSRKVKT